MITNTKVYLTTCIFKIKIKVYPVDSITQLLLLALPQSSCCQ